MGNKNSNTNDVSLNTDEKRQQYVDRFYERTTNEQVIKWKEYKFPITNPIEFIAEDGTKFATFK